jgi:uncharacterized membrane protein YdbT with pleckstrin-like domain
MLEQVLDVVVIAVVLGIAFAAPNGLVSSVSALVAVALSGGLLWRFMERRYTRYVLTDLRVIRVSGVLRRDHEWISWTKVTDVSVKRSLVDRLVGTATIHIQSANEASGFAAMTDVPQPTVFAQRIADLVSAARRDRH